MIQDAAPLVAVAAIGAPLSGAVLAFLIPAQARGVALTTALATLAAAIGTLLAVESEGTARYALGNWPAPLGITLHIDSLAALLLVMTALVSALASVSVGRHGSGGRPLFWPLWLSLWAGLNALFLAGDLFNIYVTLELVGLAAAALTGFGAGREAVEAALRYLLVNLIGSLCYLMGVAVLYRTFGVLDIVALAAVIEPAPATFVAFALMVGGLLLKTALFPLHFWLPPAHANAPAAVSAVLSGLVVKATFYLVLRLWLELFGEVVPSTFGQLLGVLGGAAVIWGSIQALRAPRLKMLVAYSTVAQLGYLFLAFALLHPSNTTNVVTAVVVFALAHAFAKAAMFLAAGAILHETGHDRISTLAVTGRRLGPALFALGLAGISIVGLPPSGGFAAKWMLLTGALAGGAWLVAAVFVSGSLLAAAYVLRPLAAAFRPPAAGDDAPASGSPGAWPAVALALGSLALGFASPGIEALLNAGEPRGPAPDALP